MPGKTGRSDEFCGEEMSEVAEVERRGQEEKPAMNGPPLTIGFLVYKRSLRPWQVLAGVYKRIRSTHVHLPGG